MTTLTMRLVKGDFIVTGPDIAPMKFKSRPRGARLVQDAPSRLADHGGWPRRQASATQETGALTRPAAEPAQAFFRLLVHPTRAGDFKAATGTRGGQATASKKGRGHPPSRLAQVQEPRDARRAVKRKTEEE